MLAGERAKGDEASPRSTIFRTSRLLTAGLELGVAGKPPLSGNFRHTDTLDTAPQRRNKVTASDPEAQLFGSRPNVLLFGTISKDKDWRSLQVYHPVPRSGRGP
jgi:hypothetical protein